MKKKRNQSPINGALGFFDIVCNMTRVYIGVGTNFTLAEGDKENYGSFL